MSSRQRGLRSLSMTAARTPSRNSPSRAGAGGEAVLAGQRLLDAGVAAGGADEREGAGHRQRAQAAQRLRGRRGPSRWPRGGRRWRRGRRPRRRRRSRSASAARAAAGAGSAKAATAASGSPVSRSAAVSSGQRSSGTKLSAKPARMASPGPMRWPVRPRYSPSRPGAAARMRGGADVGDEADGAFGHRDLGGRADDAVAAMAGDADAAAHDEALHQRDTGLGVARRSGRSSGTRRPRSARPRRSRRGGRCA